MTAAFDERSVFLSVKKREGKNQATFKVDLILILLNEIKSTELENIISFQRYIHMAGTHALDLCTLYYCTSTTHDPMPM